MRLGLRGHRGMTLGDAGSERSKDVKWPVGQVVKTEASHAFNIGSNPVRVTTPKETRTAPFPADAENCAMLLPFVVPNQTRCAGL